MDRFGYRTSREESDSQGHVQPRRMMLDESPEAVPSLTWFPKKFLEGDLDGEGAEKMLGRSVTLDPTEILVRETAQNSWDARIRTLSEVDFELHLRRVTSSQQAILRDRVFTGDRYKLEKALPQLRRSMSERELWVLEVHDRGTRGLGGPDSSRVTPEPGDVTDFRDFVLNLGSPRDQDHGGGTYGFGKTAAYKASRCDSILIWSSYKDRSGGLRSRLIASSMGRSFDLGGIRHTGRHWWAVRGSEPETFAPATESWAGELGDELFSRRFGGGATGTSLMIIDPDMGDRSPAQFMESLKDAVMKHLWPKMHPDPGRAIMRIKLSFDESSCELPLPSEHPVVSHYARALDAVRVVQRGGGRPSAAMVFVIKGRPRGHGQTVLGHLAIAPFPHTDESKAFLGEEIVSHLALMRNQAELVVRYVPHRRHPEDLTSYAAVFKPVLDHDDAFADSEPPAHDEWAFESVVDASHKSVVRVALTKIEDEIKRWTTPAADLTRATAKIRPAAVLADALAGLLPGSTGSAVQRHRKGTGTRSGGGARKPSAVATGVVHHETAEGRMNWLMKVELVNASSSTYRIEPRLGVATIDKDDFDAPDVQVLGWDPGPEPPDPASPPEEADGSALSVAPGDVWWLRVAAPPQYALSVDFRVSEHVAEEERD